MATVIVDEHQEYIWQAPDQTLSKVLEYVMRHVDPTSPFHELLYASKTYGNLEFFRLGEVQRNQLEVLVQQLSQEKQALLANTDDSSEQEVIKGELKTIKQLLDLIGFSKGF